MKKPETKKECCGGGGCENPIVLLSEEMLSKYDNSIVDRILYLYKVDLDSQDRKLTTAFKRELILKAQKEYYNQNNSTPKGLEQILGEDYFQNTAKVYIDLGYTINTGNYNSIKVGGGMTVPVGADRELMQECMKTYRQGFEILKERLTTEIKNLT